MFYLLPQTSRISKLINHYELYKKIVSLKGDIIVCGVFKGNSLIRFLTFREILENSLSRKIYGFDVFGKFPKANNKFDKKFLKKWNKNVSKGIEFEELNKIIKKKGFSNFKLEKGDITKTIPNLIKNQPKLKIALLHLDMDIYESTKFALDKLFEFVVKGGLILIDDYKHVYGATKATNEFLKKFKNL